MTNPFTGQDINTQLKPQVCLDQCTLHYFTSSGVIWDWSSNSVWRFSPAWVQRWPSWPDSDRQSLWTRRSSAEAYSSADLLRCSSNTPSEKKTPAHQRHDSRYTHEPCETSQQTHRAERGARLAGAGQDLRSGALTALIHQLHTHTHAYTLRS